MTSAAPHVKSGRLRALAVTSATRNSLLPEVPTMVEQGLPAVVADSWAGLAGPRDLPANVVQLVNQACQKALASTEVRERLSGLGLATMPGTSKEATLYISDEVDKWSKVVTAGNIRV
ncbi:tripartite tricarboxylate transporter substrate-binding protein [Paucibacter sp. O1-1]|nr:tripartite tricarboxylate transporter substrate-binding protein [Paucibacter sp. O1-1]MDA3825046.1 tripartite tricarboxylate transporter substrate-binding protein [Paucibacter sp. O1-1]